MGFKPNWGAGLSALGRDLGYMAQQQRQDRLMAQQRQQQLDDAALARTNSNEDWIARQKWLAKQKAAEAAQDPMDAVVSLPGGGASMPSTGYASLFANMFDGTPELQGLTAQQGMGIPVTKGDLLGQMQTARERMQKEQGAATTRANRQADLQAGIDARLASSKELADYKNDMGADAPASYGDELVDWTYPDWVPNVGGKKVKIPRKEMWMMIRKFGTKPGDDNMTTRDIEAMSDNLIPLPDVKRRWDKDANDGEGGWSEGVFFNDGVLSTGDQSILGTDRVSALHRDMMEAVSKNRKNPNYGYTAADSLINAIGPDDVPLDNALKYYFGEGASIDNNGTPTDKSDDKIVTPRSWNRHNTIKIADVKKKLLEKSKGASKISYAAAERIAKELGISIDEYQAEAGGVDHEKVLGDEQNQNISDIYNFIHGGN